MWRITGRTSQANAGLSDALTRLLGSFWSMVVTPSDVLTRRSELCTALCACPRECILPCTYTLGACTLPLLMCIVYVCASRAIITSLMEVLTTVAPTLPARTQALASNTPRGTRWPKTSVHLKTVPTNRLQQDSTSRVLDRASCLHARLVKQAHTTRMDATWASAITATSGMSGMEVCKCQFRLHISYEEQMTIYLSSC